MNTRETIVATLTEIRDRHPEAREALNQAIGGIRWGHHPEPPAFLPLERQFYERLRVFRGQILDLCVAERAHAKILVFAAEFLARPGVSKREPLAKTGTSY